MGLSDEGANHREPGTCSRPLSILIAPHPLRSLLLGSACLVLAWTTPALATWAETLVMPGEVSAAHADLTDDCGNCHSPLDKDAQVRLCLDCHKEVDADAKDKRGFHGRSPEALDRPCRRCHVEHKGRDTSLIRLDRDKFDHRLTDRPLVGAHFGAPCEGCHQPGRKFRDASTRCSDCHSKDDPHEGTLGLACDHCHEEAGWKTVRFDHDTAKFRLEGKHRDAKCDGCHKTRLFKSTATDCFSCHQKDDQHRGSFGKDCRSCHTPKGFAGTTFDHARKTKFPLSGTHARVSCGKCHRDGRAAAETTTSCAGCHQGDEPHQGQFGNRCETCHSPVDWHRATFDHDRSTSFPLRGRHVGRRCQECHRGGRAAAQLDTKCVSCHRANDVHRGRQGKDCKRCHDERGWSRDVLVDHNATKFPLTGAHGRVPCLLCHHSVPFKDLPTDCVACHQKDATLHRCARGNDCARCHDTTSFRTIRAAH